MTDEPRLTAPGWTTSHRVRSTLPLETLCGSPIHQPVEAPPDMKPCGQCERRKR